MSTERLKEAALSVVNSVVWFVLKALSLFLVVIVLVWLSLPIPSKRWH